MNTDLVSVILIYGGETEDNGTKLGPEGLQRILTALDFIRRNPNEYFIILLCPGQRPGKKQYPLLKNVMAAEIEKQLPENCKIILARADAWTTLSETLAAKEEIIELERFYEIKAVYACSNWYHKLRVTFFWRKYPKRVVFISALTIQGIFGVTLSLLWEAAGFAKIIFNFLKERKV